MIQLTKAEAIAVTTFAINAALDVDSFDEYINQGKIEDVFFPSDTDGHPRKIGMYEGKKINLEFDSDNNLLTDKEDAELHDWYRGQDSLVQLVHAAKQAAAVRALADSLKDDDPTEEKAEKVLEKLIGMLTGESDGEEISISGTLGLQSGELHIKIQRPPSMKDDDQAKMKTFIIFMKALAETLLDEEDFATWTEHSEECGTCAKVIDEFDRLLDPVRTLVNHVRVAAVNNATKEAKDAVQS